MSVTETVAVIKAVKTAKEVFEYLRSRTKNAEEASKLIQLQESFLALREENTQLREELRRRDTKAARREGYERKQIGQAVVLVPVGADGPVCCPKCRDDQGDPLPLQGLTHEFHSIGTHLCGVCKTTFSISA